MVWADVMCRRLFEETIDSGEERCTYALTACSTFQLFDLRSCKLVSSVCTNLKEVRLTLAAVVLSVLVKAMNWLTACFCAAVCAGGMLLEVGGRK